MKKLALILVFLAGGSFVLAQQEQMQGHMMSADGEHAHDNGHVMSSGGMSGDAHMMHHGSGESCPSTGADSGQCPHGSRVQAEGMITLGMLEKKPALVPGEDGLRALKVAKEIHHQIQKGF